jgi:small-conductance mechanosensitive channel
MNSRVNHVAVFVSAIAFYVLGYVWYDLLFNRTWMALTGHTPIPASQMTMPLAGGFLLCWFLAYVIGVALADTTNPNPGRHGAEFGIFMGLGIWGSMLALNYLYEGRGIALWLITTGYVVIGMAMMGAIIGAWRTVTARAAGSR